MGISRRAWLIGCEAAALVLLCLALVLGAHEFTGTFGSSTPVSCGSVWGLVSVDDLNAKSCTDDLRTRLTVVAVMITVAGLLAAAAPVMLYGNRLPSVTARGLLASFAGVVPVALGFTIVGVGRHLIWSVSGA